MTKYDAIVLGLGAMGSATAYQLARRGKRVLGIDQYAPPHIHGSTHGDTRITRLAIGEGDYYSPLALRSHQIWREIEARTGAQLLTCNGGLIIAANADEGMERKKNFFEKTLAAATKYGIAHEMLDAAEMRRRFPQFRIQDGETGYYEPEAGFLRPEECIRAQLALAREEGAELHTGEKALGFDETATGVRVTTDKGRYEAERLILSAGPWLPGFLGAEYAPVFRVFRQVLFWFDVKTDIAPFMPDRFPIFIWGAQGARRGIYGFPAIDGPEGGVKIAGEQYETTTTPQAAERKVTREEIAAMYEDCIAPCFPGLSARCVKAVTCLYTVTPDSGFVIDELPGVGRVIVASPCSGHGFKHSAAIGEALAELVTAGRSKCDLSAFGIARFTKPRQAAV